MTFRDFGRDGLRASRVAAWLRGRRNLPRLGRVIEWFGSTRCSRIPGCVLPGRRQFGRIGRGMRQSLLMLEQLEKRLLGLLLTFEELPVKVGGLLGQPLQGGQIFLGRVEGESQAGGCRRILGILQPNGARGSCSATPRAACEAWTVPWPFVSSTACGRYKAWDLAWPFE